MTRERSKSVQVRTAAYQTVRRLRTELSIAFLGGGFSWAIAGERCLRSSFVGQSQQVTGAAASVEQRRVLWAVNFAAKAIYVNFDEVGERIKLLVPNVLGDFRAADDAANAAHEKFEQRVFLVGERDVTASAASGLSGGVQRQRFYGKLRGL